MIVAIEGVDCSFKTTFLDSIFGKAKRITKNNKKSYSPYANAIFENTTYKKIYRVSNKGDSSADYYIHQLQKNNVYQKAFNKVNDTRPYNNAPIESTIFALKKFDIVRAQLANIYEEEIANPREVLIIEDRWTLSDLIYQSAKKLIKYDTAKPVIETFDNIVLMNEALLGFYAHPDVYIIFNQSHQIMKNILDQKVDKDLNEIDASYVLQHTVLDLYKSLEILDSNNDVPVSKYDQAIKSLTNVNKYAKAFTDRLVNYMSQGVLINFVDVYKKNENNVTYSASTDDIFFKFLCAIANKTITIKYKQDACKPEVDTKKEKYKKVKKSDYNWTKDSSLFDLIYEEYKNSLFNKKHMNDEMHRKFTIKVEIIDEDNKEDSQ